MAKEFKIHALPSVSAAVLYLLAIRLNEISDSSSSCIIYHSSSPISNIKLSGQSLLVFEVFLWVGGDKTLSTQTLAKSKKNDKGFLISLLRPLL